MISSTGHYAVDGNEFSLKIENCIFENNMYAHSEEVITLNSNHVSNAIGGITSSSCTNTMIRVSKCVFFQNHFDQSQEIAASTLPKTSAIMNIWPAVDLIKDRHIQQRDGNFNVK